MVCSNSVGTNIAINALATINGPNGIYSFAPFFLLASIAILIIAANKMIILIQ